MKAHNSDAHIWHFHLAEKDTQFHKIFPRLLVSFFTRFLGRTAQIKKIIMLCEMASSFENSSSFLWSHRDLWATCSEETWQLDCNRTLCKRGVRKRRQRESERVERIALINWSVAGFCKAYQQGNCPTEEGLKIVEVEWWNPERHFLEGKKRFGFYESSWFCRFYRNVFFPYDFEMYDRTYTVIDTSESCKIRSDMSESWNATKRVSWLIRKTQFFIELCVPIEPIFI